MNRDCKFLVMVLAPRLALIACLTPLLTPCVGTAAIPNECSQLLVGKADSWDSSVGQLRRFERVGGSWAPVGDPVRVLFGKNGLAWGIGVAGQEQAGPQKIEGDRRAPAGVFALGRIFGDAAALPLPSSYPYHQVTPADAWIENPAHPLYNQHVRVDPSNPPAWFRSEQMKQKDPAHKWKLEIRHNAEHPIPGRGSAIFFHIQRGPNRTSAGCTTMPEAELLKILQWLKPRTAPHYVLLPVSEYQRLASQWQLPSL